MRNKLSFSFNRFTITALFIICAAIGVSLGTFTGSRAQLSGFVGASQVPGFATGAVNASAFSPATVTGAAGTVTNPASNFVIQVDGGPVFCAGGEDNVTESNLSLAASQTYLIVYNCPQNAVYAKTAVTGPGTSATTGLPTALLFATPSVEIALATVVCNATACGNGGNGSITDNRATINFPNGKQLSKIAFASLNASAPDGAQVICTSCTALSAGSATCTSGAAVVLATRVGGAWRCY